MTKVEHTKTHNIPIELTPTIHGLIATRDKKQVLVTDAELVLVECLNSQKALFFRFVNDDVIHLKTDTLILTKFIFYLIPILISRTEKIEVGDWFILALEHIPKDYRICKMTNTAYSKEEKTFEAEELDGTKFTCGYHILYKILALPEHFSPQQLQDIVDGRWKEGKCLVECERYGSPAIELNDKGSQIKLNPLTIYPIEEKMYAREDVISYLNTLNAQEFHNYSTDERIGYLQAIRDVKKWFEQNVK